MKTKTLLIGLFLTALILAPIALAAEEPPQRGPRGGGQGGPGGFGNQAGIRGAGMDFDPLERLLGQLNLTPEQQAKIDTIREENQEKVRQTRTALRDAMQALNEAVEDGSEEKIIAAGKAVGEAQTQSALLRAKINKQIKAVLTEEQLAKLNELRAQMRERLLQRRQQGAQGPQNEPGDQPRPRRQRPPQE